MTELYFYGGVSEIGGNKIFLGESGSNIFLDFGLNFGRKDLYYEEFLQPRSANGLGDFLEMGLLPDLKNVYRQDLLEIIGRGPEVCKINGVFLSHAHADHANYISFLNENIPVYCGRTSHLLLQSISESGQSGIENEILRFKKRPIIDRKAEPIERTVNEFRTGNNIRDIPGLDIVPVHVDHSVPGAYGYIVHTKEGAVVYSGDYRFHGLHSEMTDEFVEAAAATEPIAMISEGTTIGRSEVHKIKTEEKVCNECLSVVNNSNKFVVADFNFKDVDRIQTFIKIARETGRKFVITLKDACILKWLCKDNVLKKSLPEITDEIIRIYQPRKKLGLYKETDYSKWEREYLGQNNVWKAEDVHRNQKNVIMAITLYQIGELIDIKPAVKSTWIQAHSEPFNEEMNFDHNRFLNWLEHFKFERFQSHASGHASPDEIKAAVERIKPEKLFIVHTAEPDMCKDLLKDINCEIITPVEGKQYNLGHGL